MLLSCPECNLYTGFLAFFNVTTFKKVYQVDGFSGRGGMFSTSVRVLKSQNNTLDLIVASMSRQNLNDFYSFSPVRIHRNTSTGIFNSFI